MATRIPTILYWADKTHEEGKISLLKNKWYFQNLCELDMKRLGELLIDQYISY
jgi:hypothetical protein